MAINYTDSIGFNKGAVAYPAVTDEISKIEVLLDFAVITAARAAAGVAPFVATNTLQVINIPPRSVIFSAGMVVLSAETIAPTATFNLGFTGDTPFAANVYGNLLATNAVGLQGAALTSPSFIGVADTIDILFNVAVPRNARLKIFAFVGNAG